MKYLSKSNFMTFLECSLKFYNEINKEEKESLSDSAKLLIYQGTEFGKIAQQLYPQGTLIKASNFVHQKVLDETSSVKEWTELFEAGFSSNVNGLNLYCRVDILTKDALIEVKSSTKVKDEHIMDLLYQKYVLSKNGINPKDIYVYHINSNYVLDGKLDINQLIVKARVNDLMESLEKTLINSHGSLDNFFLSTVTQIQSVLISDKKPASLKGSHCGAGTSKQCPFFEKCFGKDSVGVVENISRLTDAKKLALSEILQVELSAVDKVSMKLIPDSALTVGKKKGLLTELQSIDVLAVKNPKKLYFNENELRSYMKTFKSKRISYIDFETFMSAIPLFQGTRPYQQVPFQFVVYRHFNGSLEKTDYIHGNKLENPFKGFAMALINAVGDAEVVVAFNISFERKIIEELIIQCPEFEKELMAIINKLYDLNVPFAKKWICHQDFMGSSSLKAILNVMCPNFSYHDLNIQRGDNASALYTMWLLDKCKDSDKLFADLTEYCGLDVLAMVKISSKILEDLDV